MADDPTQPISSDDLLKAARDSVGSDEDLSEQMLRAARKLTESPTPPEMPDPTYPTTDPGDTAPVREFEAPTTTAAPPPVAAPKPTQRPQRAARSRPSRPTSPPPGPLGGDKRPRIPRAVRGLIPLVIFGFIFLFNFFGDDGGEPDSVAVEATVVTQAPQSGVEVRSDQPSVNLALRSAVVASGQTPDRPAERAVDGDPAVGWNSGGFPSQWIDIDLGGPATVREVRLRVGQSPAVGDTIHAILVRGPGTNGEELLFHAFEGQTRDSSWITAKPTRPWAGIDHVRVFTLESPSWVAWFEIEVLGVAE
jgi:hypothetical protein